MIKPWPKVSSKSIGDFRVFKLRADRKVSPRTGKEHEFYILDSANWVNVMAVTPDQQLVMIEQFRHGSGTVELEIPGGLIDAGETSPVAAAVRELREETGYEGENARILGQILPNPAILSNTCYTVMLENCRCLHPVEFDHGEDLLTRLVPAAELPRLVAEGSIQHSLVVVALYYFELWQRGLKKL
jgi:ADP-ribose pyrophosphatase